MLSFPQVRGGIAPYACHVEPPERAAESAVLPGSPPCFFRHEDGFQSFLKRMVDLPARWGDTAQMGTGGHSAAVREAQDRFVAAWGQMAGAWGISRTMAEVHALLYITGQGLCTDDVMERLQISRGNASMSLRALLDWGIVRRANKRGDRKEYFESEQDVWAMLRRIVRERLKREADPLLAELHEIRDLTAERGKGRERGDEAQKLGEHNRRIEAMLEFFTILTTLGQQFVSPAGTGLRHAASLLGQGAEEPSRTEGAR